MATGKKSAAPKQERPTEGTMPGLNGGTLTRARKGEVLNPKGRGKGRLNNKTILNKWLSQQVNAENPATGRKEKMTALEAMTIALIGKAMQGDHKAYRELMDRMEGRPRQTVAMVGEDDGPIQMEVSHDVDYTKLDDATLKQIQAARTSKHG